jgi:hypothetical protein
LLDQHLKWVSMLRTYHTNMLITRLLVCKHVAGAAGVCGSVPPAYRGGGCQGEAALTPALRASSRLFNYERPCHSTFKYSQSIHHAFRLDMCFALYALPCEPGVHFASASVRCGAAQVTLFEHSLSHGTPDACFPNNWFSTHPVGEGAGGVAASTLVLYPMKVCQADNLRLNVCCRKEPASVLALQAIQCLTCRGSLLMAVCCVRMARVAPFNVRH